MTLTRRRISPKELAALGWTCIRKSGRYKDTVYQHHDGWEISHCGHPTALWPYMLVDPEGSMILTGAAGPMRRADFGVAWPTVAAAVDYVTDRISGIMPPPLNARGEGEPSGGRRA